jgi:hypothetical protein
VLVPDVIEEVVGVALERLRPTLEERVSLRQQLRGELASAEQEIGRLVSAIATGGNMPGSSTLCRRVKSIVQA